MAGIVQSQDEPPSSEDFDDEAEVIIEEGLASVAVRSLGNQSQHRDQPYMRAFRQVALNAQMRSMAADAAGSRVLADLRAHGIPTAVVKGPAIAGLHPEGWPRPYNDIDVVVSRQHVRSAISRSESLGFVYPERAVSQWKWFDLVCREGINLHSSSGGNIDFHHHLPPWVLGSHLTPEEIIARSQRHALCAIPVNFAAPEDLMIVSALHILNDLWKGKSGLTSWRDVMISIKRIGEPQAQNAFARVELGWLFDLLADEMMQAVPEVGINPSCPSPALPLGPRLHVAALGWSNDSRLTRLRLAWATRLPPLNAIAFLAGTAVPSAEYIRTRDGSYRNYWSRTLKETFSTERGSDYRMTTVENGSRRHGKPRTCHSSA
jgi:hypothetical protein